MESRLRLARLVAGRRSKFVAIGAWILLVAGLAPFAGKFEGAQKNEPSTFLPGNAESVEVLEAAQTFPSGDATIATIVFHDPSGLNAAERQSIETTLDGLASEAVPGATRAIRHAIRVTERLPSPRFQSWRREMWMCSWTPSTRSGRR